MKFLVLIFTFTFSQISLGAIPEMKEFECDDGSVKTIDKSNPSAEDVNGYEAEVKMLNGGKAASVTFENGTMVVCTEKRPGFLFY